jgi:hypothetical protein
LFIYAGMDGMTRHLFANALLTAHAESNHPVVAPRLAEIIRDLRARPPALILAGNPPFPALREFLREKYLPSPLGGMAPDGRGLWVREELYARFHAQSAGTESPGRNAGPGDPNQQAVGSARP